MTNQPLRRILHRPDMTSRLAAWTIELSQFNIDYMPRSSTRSQALADFTAECNFGQTTESIITSLGEKHVWTLFTDGSSTVASGGAGIILTSPEGFKIQQAIKFKFCATNNEAEYEALLAGIKLAQHLEVHHINIFSDSQLLVKQIMGEFKAINDRMLAYKDAALRILETFDSWTLENVGRSVNHWADALSKLATSSYSKVTDPVYIKELDQPSILEVKVCIIEAVED